jgi:hypothetical protein
VVSEDAIGWFGQIRMSIKTGIEKGHRHAAPGEALVRVHSERRRQNKIVLFKDC